MAANVFGAWSWIFIMAITLATLAIALPIAVIKALCRLEQAGTWLAGRLQARASLGNRSLAGDSPSGGSPQDFPTSSSLRRSHGGRQRALTSDAPSEEYR